MSREPGPKTTTLGASMADSITLRSTTIVRAGAPRARAKFPGGVNNRTRCRFFAHTRPETTDTRCTKRAPPQTDMLGIEVRQLEAAAGGRFEGLLGGVVEAVVAQTATGRCKWERARAHATHPWAKEGVAAVHAGCGRG
eukprot:scaffold3432_cov64-Phaeocystis_antarctica.AAC.2